MRLLLHQLRAEQLIFWRNLRHVAER